MRFTFTFANRLQGQLQGHHDTIWLQGLEAVPGPLAPSYRRLRLRQTPYSGRTDATMKSPSRSMSRAASSSRHKIALLRRLGRRHPHSHSVIFSGYGLVVSTSTNVARRNDCSPAEHHHTAITLTYHCLVAPPAIST